MRIGGRIVCCISQEECEALVLTSYSHFKNPNRI
jgi:hypothetical protein